MIKFFTAAVFALVLVASSKVEAQDYDAETETAISGLGGISGLSALANGVVTGYAPMGSGSEIDGSESAENADSSDNSDADSGDYEEDSSASEEQPILAKFLNFLSGGRRSKTTSVSTSADEQADTPVAESQVHSRVKRGAKGWVPYVSTYVKTDKKANFKWGVKAKVGKKYGR